MTISKIPPEFIVDNTYLVHEETELDDLRARLNSVLAVGLFADFDQYITHCAQVGVTAHCVLGDLKYSVGSELEHSYRAARVGRIYTPSHIEGLVHEISMLRQMSPEGWRELPLFELVGLTDAALLKIKTARERREANRWPKSREDLVREHYLSNLNGHEDSVNR